MKRNYYKRKMGSNYEIDADPNQNNNNHPKNINDKIVPYKNNINNRGTALNKPINNDITKTNNNDSYKEILQLLKNNQSKNEQIYEEIISIKKENSEMKEEMKNMRLLLEKRVINNNKDSSINSNQTREFKQILDSLKNQINIIKTIIENNKNVSFQNMNKDERTDNKQKKVENIAANNKDIILDNNIQNQSKSNKELKNFFQIKNIKEKINLHYFKVSDELEDDLCQDLVNSINDNHKIELNINQVFERQEVEKRNQEIHSKIKKQLPMYKKTVANYMFQRANFLKNVGFLVRYSHEIANYSISVLLNIFKEFVGFHSLNEENIRLHFASWIKQVFNEKYFLKVINNQKILSQITNLLDLEEGKLFKELFPNLIQLYFLCYLTDIKVNIIYAKENDEFNYDSMFDDLLSDSDVERRVLFTFLPGLYANSQFFQYSNIHVVTYKIDNPKKFPFQRPIFSNFESNVNIEFAKKINTIKFFYEKKNKIKDGLVEFEFKVATEPDITWDFPKYEFVLLDCNNYKIDQLKYILKEGNYRRCICNIILNNKTVLTSSPIELDLT